MTKVILASITTPRLPPELNLNTAEEMMTYHARQSNPAGQQSQTPETVESLIFTCVRRHHWSVFEQASIGFQVDTTRDVAAQIIRHKSLAFQEFSQRYANAELLTDNLAVEIIESFEPRLQDTKNRQSSLPIASLDEVLELRAIAATSINASVEAYDLLLSRGVAKEVARRILPMSTPTRISVYGTVRDIFFYLLVRNDLATQKEHREVAEQMEVIFKVEFPLVHQCLEYLRIAQKAEAIAWSHLVKARKSGKVITGWKVTPEYEDDK